MKISKRLKLVSCEIGPNYQLDDGFVALQSLLFGSSKISRDHCRNWFINYLAGDDKRLNSENLELIKDSRNLNFTDNGRTALYLLLKSLGLKSQSQVMIQGFSCVVLPNSVWQADLDPILIDARESSYNLSCKSLKSKLTSKSKVVIVQYTFGIVPNLDELIDFCNEHNLILIEDCAHALGAIVEYKGKKYKAGTIGHGAFFSFGRDKIISTTVGGFYFWNPRPLLKKKLDNQKVLENLKRNFDTLPKMDSKRTKQALYLPILSSFLIRPFYHLQLGKIVLILARKLGLIGEIYTGPEKSGTSSIELNSKYSPKLFSLLQNQLKKFDKFNNHRRDLALLYSKELKLDYNANSVYMRYPIDLKIFDQKNYKRVYSQILKLTREYGILLGRWYTSIFMQPEMNIQEKFAKSNSGLETAYSLSDNRVINLPTNIHVDEQDAKLIVDLIKRYDKRNS